MSLDVLGDERALIFHRPVAIAARAELFDERSAAVVSCNPIYIYIIIWTISKSCYGF